MAESVAEERYVFEVEWYDQQAALVRKYLLTFYPKNGQIDMVSNEKFQLICFDSMIWKTAECS